MNSKVELKKTRIDSLDVLKTIMAFFVCVIHWSNDTGYYYLVPTRIAVPVFIVISGYFWPKTKEKQLRQIKKMLILLIETQIFYFCFYFVLKIFNGSLCSWIYDVFNMRAIFNCLVFNRAKLGGHTWYLWAVLYTMVIAMLLQEKKLGPLFSLLGVAGLGVLLIAGKYSPLVLGQDVSTYYTKTFFCVGIPFFGFGMGLKSKIIQEWIYRMPNIFITSCIILFCVLGFAEKSILWHFSIEGTRDFYISTIFMVVAVMAFMLKNQSFGHSMPFLKRIGEKYSGMIYIIHIAVITVVAKFASMFTVTNYLYQRAGFVLIFLLSLIFSILWYKGKSYFTRGKWFRKAIRRESI